MKSGNSVTPKSGDYMSYLINIWIFIPAFIYFKMISDYALNLPFKDDFDAILKFLVDFKNATGGHKLSLLISQHNEHRILSSRIVYVLYYWITGTANFRTFLFIGGLQMLGVFIISVYFLKKYIPKFWNVVAFIWGLCLFDLNNYENNCCAMAGMQNIGVIFLFTLSLLFYSIDNKKFLIPALLFQLLCIFSSGNGMIASVCLVLFTVLNKDRKAAIACAVMTITGIGLYFIGYHSVKIDGAGEPSLAAAIPFFLRLSGAHFSFDMSYSLYIGLLIFIAILVCFPIKQKFTFDKAALPFIAFLVFVVLSMATTSYFRSVLQGTVFYTSRYLVYSNILAAIAIAFVFVKLQGKKILWPVTIICALLFLRAYADNYSYGEAGFERENYRLSNMQYYYFKDNMQHAADIATDACKAEVYCIDEAR